MLAPSSSFFLRSVLLAAALALPLATSGRALAQTSATETAHVTQLFKSGKAAFAKGDMAEAERLFAEAFAIRKSSDIAANLGQSELEQQKYRRAAEHFQWALANLLPSATDAQRKAVETGLARSRAEVAILRLEIKPDGAEVLVGDQNLGKAPVAGSVYVEPGEVIVSVKRDGFVAIDKRLVVGKGTEQAVEVTLNPRDPAPGTAAGGAVSPAVDSGLEHKPALITSDSETPAHHKSLVPAYVATGVAVVGLGAGLAFTLSANSKDDDADNFVERLGGPSACGAGGAASATDCADLKDQRDSAKSSRNLALGSFIVGGVAAVVAGYFYWDGLTHNARDKAERRRPWLALTPRLDVSRAREGVGVDSVKLGLLGTF
jgi:hypothetical protein